MIVNNVLSIVNLSKVHVYFLYCTHNVISSSYPPHILLISFSYPSHRVPAKDRQKYVNLFNAPEPDPRVRERQETIPQ